MQDALGSVQSILVLGGTSDIAQATALELTRGGARRFVLAGRDVAGLDANAKELLAAGASQVDTRQFDAVDTYGHESFVREAFGVLGDVDLVLVAFGVLGDQERLDHDRQAAMDLIAVNYVGAVSVLYPVVEHMKEQGHGTICVLSTVAAERARRSNYVYGSSKAGLDWFCQGLGDALVGTGVHVMIVRPGMVRTRMTEGMEDVPLTVDPEDVAAAIREGLASGREIVWVPGPIRWVMSGLRHVPRALFRRLPV
ncbi:MAG: decaprenylphospho-beta-D-erythro-pentofuranosid-2-ulose 2-reductase [Acidimicrobiia bacterium]|nr:decaprenylphospho-beta-D-erythro-pentofuranosid-2-ulose 2-reductase [Acidimicrobiia bacterium]